MLYIILFLIVPLGEGAVPGTFFWKPRLGLDLAVPTTESLRPVNIPTKDNIEEGLVTLLEGYQVGITVIGLASGFSNAPYYPHLNPISAYYYTNVYRWALRYFSLVPYWLGGAGNDNFCDTHKVWRRRFHYVDQFVPQWLRKALVFVKEDDWKKEEMDYKRFKKYAEPAFGKHFRYPPKRFDNFRKEQTKETVLDDVSSSSLSFIN